MRAQRLPSRVILATVFLAVMVAPVGAAESDAALHQEVMEENLRFVKVYGLVEQQAMEPVNPDQAILNGAVRGMLATLDPFSSFFDKQQFELLQQQTRGETVGFGSILYLQPGKVLVLQAAPGSPSWRAGLGPGDEIVEVNGTRIINLLDINTLVDLLRRARTHPVRLGVIHPGKVVSQDIELNPAHVESPTVDKTFALAADIGYVHIASFDQKTTQELFKAINQLGGDSLKGLVLDLRNNPGGVLDSAIAAASMFLPPDVPVLSVRGRAFPEKKYRTLAAPARFNMPLVVLVNGNAASAAEVFAAALQEHDRAVIAGERTYGKGVVESVFPLSEKMGLMLTSAQYFTPSGRSIHRPQSGSAVAAAESLHATTPGNPNAFHTIKGRPLTVGGGVEPDAVLPGRNLDLWITFLHQIGAFTDFAGNYLTLHQRIDKSFEPDEKVMDEFREYLQRKRIRIPEESWTSEQGYLRTQIKASVLTLVFGLTVGEEVETRDDPQVQAAAALLPQVSERPGQTTSQPGTPAPHPGSR